MDLEGYRKKGNALFEEEKYEKVIKLLSDEVLKEFEDAELYALLARALYRFNGDADRIMNFAQKAIEIDENFYLGYIARGNAWHAIKENDKAISDYNKAIELRSDFPLAYYNRGVLWNEKGKYDKALLDYNKAIELKVDYASAYYGRGVTWKNKGEHEKAILDYTKAIELKPDAITYNNRGNLLSYKGESNTAISDYDEAIKLSPNDAIAYNNRGNVLKDKNEDSRAILDYNKAIELKPNYPLAYYNRGNLWNKLGEYAKAISDYDKAIELKPNDARYYYNRGITIRLSGKKLENAIEDFEHYLKITTEKEEIWTKRAKDYIQELKEQIQDKELSEISSLTSEIKKLLLISKGCITHYTGLSIAKKLILDENEKDDVNINEFRISEGAFLNDTSEGAELFKFLEYKFSSENEDGLVQKTFTPKPFIGSFVAESKHDDLNLWRFYGKEGGVEAKGCAITLRIKEFIEAINQSISKGSSKQTVNSEDDINFYRVAYWDHNLNKISFQIPNSAKKEETRLKSLMIQLKEKVTNYKPDDKSILEKYLNSIAFLFKGEAYKNENELRLVIKGIEFEKKFDMETTPPRVYIELINIRPLIEKITLGPKVDKPDEWAAAFHYKYDKEMDDEKKPKKILISRLPYK